MQSWSAGESYSKDGQRVPLNVIWHIISNLANQRTNILAITSVDILYHFGSNWPIIVRLQGVVQKLGSWGGTQNLYGTEVAYWFGKIKACCIW